MVSVVGFGAIVVVAAKSLTIVYIGPIVNAKA